MSSREVKNEAKRFRDGILFTRETGGNKDVLNIFRESVPKILFRRLLSRADRRLPIRSLFVVLGRLSSLHLMHSLYAVMGDWWGVSHSKHNHRFDGDCQNLQLTAVHFQTGKLTLDRIGAAQAASVVESGSCGGWRGQPRPLTAIR